MLNQPTQPLGPTSDRYPSEANVVGCISVRRRHRAYGYYSIDNCLIAVHWEHHQTLSLPSYKKQCNPRLSILQSPSLFTVTFLQTPSFRESFLPRCVFNIDSIAKTVTCADVPHLLLYNCFVIVMAILLNSPTIRLRSREAVTGSAAIRRCLHL